MRVTPGEWGAIALIVVSLVTAGCLWFVGTKEDTDEEEAADQ